MPIDKEKCKVGSVVQDSNGNVGTVRWIGRMEKAQKPPNKDVGTYAAVEYQQPTQAFNRTDGTWEGNRYCNAPPGTVEFTKPRHLDFEMNGAGVKAVREKFGDAVKEWTDYQIVKFLIARKFDLPKVFEMIDNHLKWREEFKPDFDEYFPPEMANMYPVGFGDGYDRDGNLLYFERPGNGGACNPKDFVKMFGIPRICRWHTANMEAGTKKLREHPTARRVTSIIDLKDLGDSDRAVVNFGKAIAKIDQDNYPEHLAKMYIINAPTLFVGLWKMIRLFIDDRTKAKIQIVGKEYKEVIYKQIDPKYWPSFMGGTDDSWLANGGRVGSDDPRKERDPESGAMAIAEVSDKELAAANEPTPKEDGSAAQTPAASP